MAPPTLADGCYCCPPQMDNARLRAELATGVAVECDRAAQQADALGAGPWMGAAAAQEPGAPPEAGGAASPAAEELPAADLQKCERALAEKEGMITELEVLLGRAREQVAAYQQRIIELEGQQGERGDMTPPASTGSALTSAQPATPAAVAAEDAASSPSAQRADLPGLEVASEEEEQGT